MSRTLRAMSALITRRRLAVQSLTWAMDGYPLPPPPPVKRQRLISQLRHHNLTAFVETGTFKGDTLAVMAKTGAHCVSIELDNALYSNAAKRFAGQTNVEVIHGDAGVELKRVLDKLDQPALFWLDGHFSGGSTASADLASPILAEIEHLRNWPHAAKSCIQIDDIECFTGADGYPKLGQFLKDIEDADLWRASVHMGMIELMPMR